MSSAIRTGALLGVGMGVLTKGIHVFRDSGIDLTKSKTCQAVALVVLGVSLSKILPTRTDGFTLRERCVNALKTGVKWGLCTAVALSAYGLAFGILNNPVTCTSNQVLDYMINPLVNSFVTVGEMMSEFGMPFIPAAGACGLVCGFNGDRSPRPAQEAFFLKRLPGAENVASADGSLP